MAMDNLTKGLTERFGMTKQDEESMKENLDERPTNLAFAALPDTQTAETKSLTCLAPNTSVEGLLSTKGDVQIQGRFKGEIRAGGSVELHHSIIGNVQAARVQLFGCTLTGDVIASELVFLDESSVIVGRIEAAQLDCAGKVRGNIVLSQHAALRKQACVEADLTTGTLEMERGARLDGQLKMARPEPPVAPAPKTAQPEQKAEQPSQTAPAPQVVRSSK